MRGGDNRTGELFSYVDLEARVRRDHALRTIRTIVNEALSALEREFAAIYSPIGRPSIPPEKLLRAMLLQDRPTAITLGADKAYDAEDFVNELRSMNVTPHVAQNTSGRNSAIDARTTRHGGYAASQRIRKRIEEAFGWIKTVARQEKTSFRGRHRVAWAFTFAAAAYNLVRLPKLIAGAG